MKRLAPRLQAVGKLGGDEHAADRVAGHFPPDVGRSSGGGTRRASRSVSGYPRRQNMPQRAIKHPYGGEQDNRVEEIADELRHNQWDVGRRARDAYEPSAARA